MEEGGVYYLEWQSVGGRTYAVETSNTLADWEPYCVGLLGNGGVLACPIDPGLPEARQFFRIRAERCFP